MRYGQMLLGAIALLIASHASAGLKEVQYAEIPGWVVPVPKPTDSPTPDGAPLRIVYLDYQIHLGPDGDEVFNSYRLKVLRSEALSAGNISVAWFPDAGEAKVHYVRIIRDNQVIDVLKSTGFQILQREGFLEHAVLNGQLTAALQVPGLQVGDELEFAATIRRKDPTLGDHSFGFAQLPTTGLPGAFRIQMVWPKSRKLNWRATSDVPKLSTTERFGQKELLYELRDPHSVVVADGAPARVNVRRLIEYSDFDSWKEASQRLWPLFEKASALSPQSPIRQEIARIAAKNSDSIGRIEAALQLVQDRIRYVYIGLNGGNFTPATADETWDRRFGDCKAKTALLLAILRELGIPGEAVLVNSRGGDGLNERLPTPALFDHVIVRARIGSSNYWLDGSRNGDKVLAMLPSPLFRWALPLRSEGSDLENVPTNPPKVPDSIVVLDADASRGFDQKATVKLRQILRGNVAFELRTKIVALPAEDADRALRAYWRNSNPGIEPETVSWRYDEQRATLMLMLTGEEKLEWSGTEGNGYSLDIPGAGFTAPAELHRPKEQDKTAPWIIDYPTYRCWVTAIQLPKGNPDWRWDYYSDPVSTHMGGVDYWRASDLRDNVMRTVMSKRFDLPEITAAEADELNKRLPSFNNNISRVYQILLEDKASTHERTRTPPFQADTDWSSPVAPCGEKTN
jgi:hypothetical protein